MPLIGAEAAAASLTAFLASAVLFAYLADRIGFPIAPFALVAAAAATAATVWLQLRRRATADRPAVAAVLLIASGTFAWLMFQARPDFLPTGTGSDLAHHLAFLGYLEQHGRLPRDPALGAWLGEMIDYTPGFHLLTMCAATLFRRDALHLVHAVVAVTAALKCAIVFLIARRLMPDGVPRVVFAAIAALLVWLPYTFFAGSFMEQSFLSQAVSELFAVAMWWALVVWRDEPSAGAMALFALFGVAAFLTWPIWIGPLTLTLLVTVTLRRDLSAAARLQHLAVALLPIAGVAAMYTSSRLVYGVDMVHAVGFAVWPTPRVLGWPFAALASAGLAWAAVNRRARGAALLLGAIGLQAAALFVTGRSVGAVAPYLSLKMAYLAIYPLSIAAALMIAGVSRKVLAPTALARFAWLPLALVALAVVRTLAMVPRAAPVVTEPVFLAGSWARAHVPPACVDYLVADGYTAYWLHLAVLGNPRAAGRTPVDDTFEPRQALVRWIVPGGLPYAVADNFDGLPRDIRTNVDVLARFGPAAVVKRRGASACDSKP